MALTIPLQVRPPGEPHIEMQVTLERVVYSLEFLFNQRQGAWFLNIRTEAGELLLAGIRVVVGFPLGRRSPNPKLPPGLFVAVDTSGANLDPGENDLGGRVQLLYFESAEVAALRSA
jgi:hypothetical protein